MTRHPLATLFVCATAATITSSVSANLLSNPGFEDPITMDGPPFVGSWEGFVSGAPNTEVLQLDIQPRSGVQHIDLRILGDDNSFAGVFQDVPNLVEGSETTFSGWHKHPGAGPIVDVGVEIRIEWRDSVNDVEIARTDNLTTAPPSDLPFGEYGFFSLTDNVPSGADTARVVYAIQTFGGEPGPGNNGIVLLDDFEVLGTQVPEPASTLLAGLGLGGLVLGRRWLIKT